MTRLLLATCLALTGLALAAPALAADATVTVGDDFFDPAQTSIGQGEKVTWNWATGGVNDHDVVTLPRQIDRFRSPIQHGTGATFSRTLKYPGRFRYFCEIHPDIMKGTVVVGVDDHKAPRITSLGKKVSGHTAKVSFRLSERSVVSYTLKKGKKKRSGSKVFNSGKQSLTFKHLSAGGYRVTLVGKDGFGHKGKSASKTFSVR